MEKARKRQAAAELRKEICMALLVVIILCKSFLFISTSFPIHCTKELVRLNRSSIMSRWSTSDALHT
jgi:hypothetical protein